MKDLLYKKSSYLIVRIASPVLELPFIAHNSDMIGESEFKRDRMWILNLGNIDFETLQPDKDNLFGKDQHKLDEYDRFKLIIDSISLNYMKHGKIFKAVNDVDMKLELGIKNKIKAALIEGSQEKSAIDVKFSPEVILNAQLPELTMNMTPDVYNGLVNLNQVLMSEGQEVYL